MHNTANSVFLHPSSDAEAFTLFMGINNGSSLDADGMQVHLLKRVLNFIIPSTTYIFSLSLFIGTFLERMQMPKVYALYKKGDRN